MIHLEDRGPVALLTIDRPDRRNALDHQALEDLLDAHRRATEARVLVLTGAHGHFCAGADLSGVEDPSFTDLLRQVLAAFRDDPRPTVAAVDGAALGAGTQLAVACDLRVATADARFGIPAAKLGLMVDHWTIQRLSLLAGGGPARAMLLGAEIYGGDDAARFGFVQRWIMAVQLLYVGESLSSEQWPCRNWRCRVLFAFRHPHDCARPLRSPLVYVTTLFPQSHAHSHRENPPLLSAGLIATRRPNRCPEISILFAI